MRFQLRDDEILRTIHENQGVVAKRQLKRLFWPDKSNRSMEIRLSKLCQTGYICWPSIDQYKVNPIPEPICWLGWKGILHLAGLFGVNVPVPTGTNENQLRMLQKNLYDQGINWVREPRWSLLRHDLVVIDFKLKVMDEIAHLPGFSVENWKYDTEFRSDPDLVSYTAKDRNGIFKQLKKRVLPDGYFEIVDEERRSRGEADRVRFLLEIDMSTHDNPSFGIEKVAPGVAYIKSPAFKTRFGFNSGRWLVVTNGGRIRLRNLMRQTRENAREDSGLFFFTTLTDIENSYPLTSPIWQQVDREEPRALLSI
jgi:hypothetical protein